MKLELVSNNIKEIDSLVKVLKDLVELDLSENKYLVSLPEELCECSSLAKLKLRECKSLRTLPEKIGELQKLQVFELEGCEEL